MVLHLTAVLIAAVGYLAQRGSLPKTLLAASQAEAVGNCLISLGCTIFAALVLLKINSLDDLKNVQSPRSRLRFILLYNAALAAHVPLTLYYLEQIAQVDGPRVFGDMILEFGLYGVAFTASNLLFLAPLVVFRQVRGRDLYHFPAALFDFKTVRIYDPRSLIAVCIALALLIWCGMGMTQGDWFSIPTFFTLIYVVLSWRASFTSQR